MKSKNVDHKYREQTRLRNYQLYNRKLIVFPSLGKSLQILWQKYHGKNLEVFGYGFKNPKVDKSEQEVEVEMMSFITSLSESNLNKFKENIQTFLEENQFGQEWYGTLSRLVVTGCFMPPDINANYSVEPKGSYKTIRLEVGPETTLRDLQLLWTDVEKAQKRVYPEYVKHGPKEQFDIEFSISLYTQIKQVNQKNLNKNSSANYRPIIESDDDIAKLLMKEFPKKWKTQKQATDYIRKIRSLYGDMKRF
jgi:hypothetical protein